MTELVQACLSADPQARPTSQQVVKELAQHMEGAASELLLEAAASQ